MGRRAKAVTCDTPWQAIARCKFGVRKEVVVEATKKRYVSFAQAPNAAMSTIQETARVYDQATLLWFLCLWLQACGRRGLTLENAWRRNVFFP
jgi:hypothetical protein